MKITLLVENTPKDASIPAEHGLSFYIEGCGKRILLDAGQRSLFAENAARLGVDLAAVDFAVLSHGHGDHSGGLPAFRAANPAAPIYMARAATRRCYLRRCGILYFNVGMDRVFAKDALIAPLDADTELAPGVTAVVGIPRASAYLTTSDNLYMRKGFWFARDDFAHELALVLREGARTFVFSSCSHTGLQNIMKRIADAGLLGQETRCSRGCTSLIRRESATRAPSSWTAWRASSSPTPPRLITLATARAKPPSTASRRRWAGGSSRCAAATCSSSRPRASPRRAPA